MKNLAIYRQQKGQSPQYCIYLLYFVKTKNDHHVSTIPQCNQRRDEESSFQTTNTKLKQDRR